MSCPTGSPGCWPARARPRSTSPHEPGGDRNPHPHQHQPPDLLAVALHHLSQPVAELEAGEGQDDAHPGDDGGGDGQVDVQGAEGEAHHQVVDAEGGGRDHQAPVRAGGGGTPGAPGGHQGPQAGQHQQGAAQVPAAVGAQQGGRPVANEQAQHRHSRLEQPEQDRHPDTDGGGDAAQADPDGAGEVGQPDRQPDQEQAGHRAQRPSNLALPGPSLRNDSIPMRASSEPNTSANSPASRSSPASRGRSAPPSTAALARARPTRGPRPRLAAHPVAASSTSAAATTRSTRPMARASLASTWRPERIRSLARAGPTSRLRRWVPPPPGMMPSRISGWPKRASSAATRKSQARASSQPPPRA